MFSIPNLSSKIKTLALILLILASALAFAIESQPVRRVVPDLVIFEQAVEAPEGRPVFVTTNGRTWVFEL